MTLGHSCQPQGSLPSVADSGDEQSSSVLLTRVLLPYMGSPPQCREIVLQQHPCPSPSQEGSAGNIPAGIPHKIHSSLQPWEHAWV